MKRVIGIIILMALPAVVYASSGGGGHGEGHQGIPWAGLIFSTINVSIFAWILKRFAWPGIKTWVAERREQVIGALEEAEKLILPGVGHLASYAGPALPSGQ